MPDGQEEQKPLTDLFFAPHIVGVHSVFVLVFGSSVLSFVLPFGHALHFEALTCWLTRHFFFLQPQGPLSALVSAFFSDISPDAQFLH
jgi:hypothetical protein